MHYKELVLPFDPWKDLPEKYFDKEKHSVTDVFNKYVLLKDINKETQEWFSDHGMYLNHSMIFSYLPYSKSSIHVDGIDSSVVSKQYCAINFSLGGDGELEWFELLDKSQPSSANYTRVAGAPYYAFQEDQVRLLESYKIKNPVLIDVETLHRGVNLSAVHRYSLTLRWTPKMTFEKAVEIFSPYLLN